MNLIKTDIVDPKYDVFWEEITLPAEYNEVRPVLVIANYHETDSAEAAQLKKMLEACKLAPAQYHMILMQPGERTAWHQLHSRLQPRIVFLIGISPEALGIAVHFRLNEPNNFNGCTWLPTLAISELEKNPEIKKQLWVSGMKPVFIESATHLLT